MWKAHISDTVSLASYTPSFLFFWMQKQVLFRAESIRMERREDGISKASAQTAKGIKDRKEAESHCTYGWEM
jgi:hypothetical protein